MTFQVFPSAPAHPGYCRLCGTDRGPFVLVDWFDNDVDTMVLVCETCTTAMSKAFGHTILTGSNAGTEERFLRMAALNEKLRYRLRRMAGLVESLTEMGWAGTDSNVCWCPYCVGRFASTKSLQGHIAREHPEMGGSRDGIDAAGAAQALADPDAEVLTPSAAERRDQGDEKAMLLEVAHDHEVKVDGRWGVAKIRKALIEAGVDQ